MIILDTQRHPNNAKTDQLTLPEVITGLPMPYHNTYLPNRTRVGASFVLD